MRLENCNSKWQWRMLIYVFTASFVQERTTCVPLSLPCRPSWRACAPSWHAWRRSRGGRRLCSKRCSVSEPLWTICRAERAADALLTVTWRLHVVECCEKVPYRYARMAGRFGCATSATLADGLAQGWVFFGGWLAVEVPTVVCGYSWSMFLCGFPFFVVENHFTSSARLQDACTTATSRCG